MVTKFEQFTYVRPEFEEIESRFENALVQFNQSTDVEEQSEAMKQINEIRNNIGTMMNLVYVRNSIDTNDEFYKAERDYLDELSPKVDDLITKYYKALVSSTFRQQLEDKWGTQLFAIADAQIKSFDTAIIPMMQKENRLTSEYQQLIASAKIDFEVKSVRLLR